MTLTEHIQPLLDKRLPAALMAGVLLSAPVLAEDHLEPVRPSPRSDEFIRYAFADAFKSDVRVRVYIDRSWYPPDMAGIRKDAGAYRIFVLRMPRDLPSLPDDPPFESFEVVGPGNTKTTIAPVRPKPAPVRSVKRCETALNSALAQRIESVWTRVILATRSSPNPRGGADGVSYTFWATLPETQGWVWSPQPDATSPSMLAQIAENMIGYCKSRQSRDLAELAAQVALLEKKQK